MFFGDFFALSKEVPAGMQTAEALSSRRIKAKSLDSRFRGNDELRLSYYTSSELQSDSLE